MRFGGKTPYRLVYRGPVSRPTYMYNTIRKHYDDVIMSAIASRFTSLTTVYLIVYSRADQRKHQSSASLAFVRGIHRRPVNSPHKGPVTRKMVPFDDVIMRLAVPPHWDGLNSISRWISNFIHHKVWSEITYPFQTSMVQPLKSLSCVYLSMLELNWIHVSKGWPWFALSQPTPVKCAIGDKFQWHFNKTGFSCEY